MLKIGTKLVCCILQSSVSQSVFLLMLRCKVKKLSELILGDDCLKKSNKFCQVLDLLKNIINLVELLKVVGPKILEFITILSQILPPLWYFLENPAIET